jgi:hydroxyacyl-ACP dehydratase HTD2-like protein with hotdog domain
VNQPSPQTSERVRTRLLRQSPVTLFRFSALTFNPHKIHYSVPWARDVEGHKDIVVHGPLNLISILDFWRDVRQQQQWGEGDRHISLIVPEMISYKATNPLYADEEYQLVLEEHRNEVTANIYAPGGAVAMTAAILGVSNILIATT